MFTKSQTSQLNPPYTEREQLLLKKIEELQGKLQQFEKENEQKRKAEIYKSVRASHAPFG